MDTAEIGEMRSDAIDGELAVDTSDPHGQGDLPRPFLMGLHVVNLLVIGIFAYALGQLVQVSADQALLPLPTFLAYLLLALATKARSGDRKAGHGLVAVLLALVIEPVLGDAGRGLALIALAFLAHPAASVRLHLP